MAEVGQRLREVPCIDALPTDMWLTSICEVREFQGLTGVQEPVVSPRWHFGNDIGALLPSGNGATRSDNRRRSMGRAL